MHGAHAKLSGWANYFSLGSVVKAYRVIEKHARKRLRHWLCEKHRLRVQGYARYPDEYLHGELGLVRLVGRKHGLLWAKT